MAFSINGFGIRVYGWADYRSDGSHIVTEWITALYLPLIPLRSFRMRSGGRVNLVIYRSTSYQILERMPLYWPQVIRTYLLLGWWAATIWLFAGTKVFEKGDRGFDAPIFLAIAATPLLLLPLSMALLSSIKPARKKHEKSEPTRGPHRGDEHPPVAESPQPQLPRAELPPERRRAPITESPRPKLQITPRQRFNPPKP